MKTKKSKSNRKAIEALAGAIERDEKKQAAEPAAPAPDPESELEAELKELRSELDGLRDQKPEPEPEPEAGAPTPKKKRVQVERDSATDLVTAKDLADQVGVEPKILRRTLRKLQALGSVHAGMLSCWGALGVASRLARHREDPRGLRQVMTQQEFRLFEQLIANLGRIASALEKNTDDLDTRVINLEEQVANLESCLPLRCPDCGTAQLEPPHPGTTFKATCPQCRKQIR